MSPAVIVAVIIGLVLVITSSIAFAIISKLEKSGLQEQTSDVSVSSSFKSILTQFICLFIVGVCLLSGIFLRDVDEANENIPILRVKMLLFSLLLVCPFIIILNDVSFSMSKKIDASDTYKVASPENRDRLSVLLKLYTGVCYTFMAISYVFLFAIFVVFLQWRSTLNQNQKYTSYRRFSQ